MPCHAMPCQACLRLLGFQKLRVAFTHKVNDGEPTETDSGRLMLTGRVPIGPGMRSLQASRLFWCGSPDIDPNQNASSCRARDLINWLLIFEGSNE